MSDRARVLVVLSIVALVAGGAIYYFFGIYRPAQDLQNARDEIAAWEKRFQEARECLLGKTPGSAKTSEALAIREMTRDPWERSRCTPLISKLTRGQGADTGIPTVETAWNELDKTALKAASAFARHVSESTTLEHDPLPESLDALDAARNKLREAAKLDAAASSGKSLEAAQTLPILDGTVKLTTLSVDSMPSAHGMILFGQRADDRADVQVVLTAGAAPKVMRVGQGSVRSVPDMGWGAIVRSATPETPTATEVVVGGLAPDLTLRAMFSVPLPEPTIAGIGGTLAGGVLVVGNATDLVIVRTKDGAVSADPALKVESAEAAVDVDGRVGVVWSTKDKTQGQILVPGGTDEPVVEVPSLGTLCLTKDRVWGANDNTAISFGGGRPVFRKRLGESVPRQDPRDLVPSTAPRAYLGSGPTHDFILQGCTADAAVFHERMRPNELTICSDDCRAVTLPTGAPEVATTTVVGGKLVAIASYNGVLGVWREGAPATFYALPENARPVLAHEWPAMALTDGKVIDVLARGETSFVVIRIPAS